MVGRVALGLFASLPLSLPCACSRDPSDAHEAVEAKAVAKQAPSPAAAALPELPTVDVAFLRRHIVALSDDAMQGRRPGTEGGAKAVAYIIEQLESLGVEPAGEGGGFTQAVPMRAVTLDSSRSSISLRPGPRAELQPLRLGEDVVASSLGPATTTQLEAPLVFVGYGVTAPEHDWDDFDGVDLRGKIAVVLVGDPPLPDDRFDGPAMTYYGRWSYKYERALEAGAVGCLVVHETAPASYDWNVVRSSWSGERYDLRSPAGEPPARLAIQGWIHAELAERLAALDGRELAGWHELALRPDFVPLSLSAELVVELVTTERSVTDVNVLGRIPGRTRPDEHVVLTAHWDHLGVDPRAVGGADAIFNGAVDNASGIAGMLGVAAILQSHVRDGRGPDRSVLLLATTAEEQGLLGSRAFVERGGDRVPLSSIVAASNLDSMNVHGRTTTIAVTGKGKSTLEDVLAEVAAAQGRTLVGDPTPEAGAYYRSDHFSFAKAGIPAIDFGGGPTMEEGGVAAGEALAHELAERYHTVADEYDPTWPLTGALQDVETMAELVLRVADAEQRPRWRLFLVIPLGGVAWRRRRARRQVSRDGAATWRVTGQAGESRDW
ncbi:M28 family peptidase [Paraliomyxa miuraensis]|uniref:M28 family peptidase n=1 Tax=Paraliomyxa miuraensis TaxID=376150 RepID=UPI0022511320|nr:M28 family peptidase [Paraliomyxa miuraensis]MCX4243800.1 M28 family peptidase [Paraliomyxa miuraensis]